jgi:hypothetical protein
MGIGGASDDRYRVGPDAWPRRSSRGRRNPRTIIACTVIAALFVGVTLVEMMQDSEPALAVTSIDRPPPRLRPTDRDFSAGPVTKEPREPGCGDFAFFFLNPTCGKPHAKHATHVHRVATPTITSGASTANRQPRITNSKADIARRTDGKAISGPPGDGAGEQTKLYTAMRVAPE